MIKREIKLHFLQNTDVKNADLKKPDFGGELMLMRITPLFLN